ncbi:hypothetical protein B296_00036370 [Ensete ventricosum]|uniref:Aspartic peptidase DDI1-type domain-containing protein n=1 Tax=Ensete ventricosum TaxID=4639 RepID=A0A426Y6G5_ENSVE|nr:hypothetical protein B296_00036370 [Ensete ventricosum]
MSQEHRHQSNPGECPREEVPTAHLAFGLEGQLPPPLANGTTLAPTLNRCSIDNTFRRRAYAQAMVEKYARREELEITFEIGEAEYPNHDDELVISVRIANAWVMRVMVDTGSFVDVLYLDALQKLSLTKEDLAPTALALIWFTGDSISPLGLATLPIIIEEELSSKTMIVTFIVVWLPSAYNVVLPDGYYATQKIKAQATLADKRDLAVIPPRPVPTEELLEVSLDKDQSNRTVKIGFTL